MQHKQDSALTEIFGTNAPLFSVRLTKTLLKSLDAGMVVASNPCHIFGDIYVGPATGKPDYVLTSPRFLEEVETEEVWLMTQWDKIVETRVDGRLCNVYRNLAHYRAYRDDRKNHAFEATSAPSYKNGKEAPYAI
jgi:hypothetical protein